jgi:ketopantoate hydroxymethyltransferase
MFDVRLAVRGLAGCALLVAAVAFLPSLASPAQAQAKAPEVLATGEADVVAAQATVKLGDTITAVISEAMVAAVEPAK